MIQAQFQMMVLVFIPELLCYDCNFNCINDIDNDNICDENEISGCTNINKHVIIIQVQRMMMDLVLLFLY